MMNVCGRKWDSSAWIEGTGIVRRAGGGGGEAMAAAVGAGAGAGAEAAEIVTVVGAEAVCAC